MTEEQENKYFKIFIVVIWVIIFILAAHFKISTTDVVADDKPTILLERMAGHLGTPILFRFVDKEALVVCYITSTGAVNGGTGIHCLPSVSVANKIFEE